jgi:hypothetical protein
MACFIDRLSLFDSLTVSLVCSVIQVSLGIVEHSRISDMGVIVGHVLAIILCMFGVTRQNRFYLQVWFRRNHIA